MQRFLAWVCSWMIRLPGYTLRVTVDDYAGVMNNPTHPPIIAAFWHNRTALMPLFYERYCKGRTAVMFISRSRDGQFVTDAASFFGIKAVRGSSSRFGSSAALAAIRASHYPRLDLAITPDGPRGPRYQIRPGLIRLAQLTQRPIIAVTYQLAWKYQLKSWDRFQIPLPFSTCHLRSSTPIFVPEEATDAELEEIYKQVTEALGGD
jgi:lysophospholipid acyltransferase (LPLAT)-like uncharacterized protein